MAMHEWTDLPADLLTIISSHLESSFDITRFASVCQSWRYSIPNNKLLKPNTLSLYPPTFYLRGDSYIDPNPIYPLPYAVYLLRSRLHPSKTWIISITEYATGRLRLRHPLTRITDSSINSIDLFDWNVTQLTTSYYQPLNCKMVNFVPSTLYFRYRLNCSGRQLYAFKPSLADKSGSCPSFVVNGLPENRWIMEFVAFNGQVYGVDNKDCIYMLDYTCMHMLPLVCANFPSSLFEDRFETRFVVSDGELYLVMSFCASHNYVSKHGVYKFLMVENKKCYYMEKVENLGGRIFVITRVCSFSISSRDLAPPLTGVCCILHDADAFVSCSCTKSGGWGAYHIGLKGKPKQFKKKSSLHFYSALFTPPF